MGNGKNGQNVEEECGIKKANRMPWQNEEWKRQTECQGVRMNGKDEQNAEEQCGIKKATRCQGGMRNGKGKQNAKDE